jgi:hypothetical protein
MDRWRGIPRFRKPFVRGPSVLRCTICLSKPGPSSGLKCKRISFSHLNFRPFLIYKVELDIAIKTNLSIIKETKFSSEFASSIYFSS